MGRARCLPSGQWGSCESDRIVVKQHSALKFLAGDAGACADPCAPNCSTPPPTDASFPPGLSTDAGIVIIPTPPPPNSCVGLSISPSAAPATDITVTSTSSGTTAQFLSQLQPLGCNPFAPPPLWFTDQFDVLQMDPAVPGRANVIVPIAGPVYIGAALGSFSSAVTANIRVAVQESGTVNPPPGGATFAQFPTETVLDPQDPYLNIVYPYNDTMFPLGLLPPLLQWTNSGQAASGGVVVTLQYPATGTPIFSVSQLVSESMTSPVPLRSAQPRYPIPQNLWFAFEQTVHRNRATLGGTGRISVRRRVGTTTYKAKSINVNFATGQLKGKVYYNSYGTAVVNNYGGAQQSTGGAFVGGRFGAATLRIDLGATAPVAVAGFNSSDTSGCYVCHTANASGTTLITAKFGGDIAHRYTFPGTPPNGGISYGSRALVFSGINPNATRVLSSAGSHGNGYETTSRLYDINGNLLAGTNMPPALKGAFPSFATNNSAVVFTHRSGSASPLSPVTGSGRAVAMMDFNGDRTFSNFRTLVDPASPTVWPRFLPAGQNGVVYQLETRTNLNGGYSETRHDCECSSFRGTTGELWWVSTGATPVAARLDRANGFAPGGVTGALPTLSANGHPGVDNQNGPGGAGFYEQRYNYEPTVLPQLVGGYSWVAFTSRRMYGNVATINPYASDPRYDNISIDPTTKKLWISAVNPNPTPGSDPSWPAFYLPGQELIAGNAAAVFALESCRAGTTGALTTANVCDSNLDCCTGSSCVLDPPPLANPPVKHCIINSGATCRAIGQSCLTTSTCCAAAAGAVCAAGVCADPPPYYSDQTFTTDFTAQCTPGTLPKWGIFEWQSKTPGDSKIRFSAQYGDGIPWMPATPAQIGLAQGADMLAPNWGTSGTKVATSLGLTKANNFNKLHITVQLLASTDRSKSPTLLDWRQTIECVPAE